MGLDMALTKIHKVDYLNRDKLAWMLVTQALIILPLLFFLPTWLWLVWGSVAFWRIQMFLGRWGMPGGLIKTLVVGICALGILVSFKGRLVTETMVSLLLCTFVLKLLEVKSNRDAQWLVMIGFVTSATQLLFNQTPLAAIYTLACCWLLLASWRAVHLSHHQQFGEGLRRSGAILLHSLPIMLVLFVVIPRIGPLWAIPTQQSTKTGFSDSLSPGDLGDLVQDRSPVFRVEFEGNPPPSSALYWRGLVLDDFNGRSWKMRDAWGGSEGEAIQNPDNLLTYHIILEPHGHHWLFALMTPQSIETGAQKTWLTSDKLLMTRNPVVQRLRYRVTSNLNQVYSTPPEMSWRDRISYLRIPTQFNPQTQALAGEWKAKGLNERAIINEALAYFNRDFTYTLKPPPLGQHSVDDFLFNTKRGFCEHFASSFAFLLRAAGIPARVAVGYQGGRWNSVENYLLVSQSDAHAWVEVWSPQLGWYLIDPTAAVAPERIEQGIDDALSEEEQALVNSVWSSSKLITRLQLHWDAANYAWQRWVLSYDNDSQQGLFSRWLGGNEPWRITLWLLGIGLAGATLFAWLMARRQGSLPLRPETRLMLKLQRKLEPRGFVRTPGDTIQAYLALVAEREPRLQTALADISQLYEAVAFRQEENQLPLLAACIRKL
jgi:transglutaminase-like putative cysteine protease